MKTNHQHVKGIPQHELEAQRGELLPPRIEMKRKKRKHHHGPSSSSFCNGILACVPIDIL